MSTLEKQHLKESRPTTNRKDVTVVPFVQILVIALSQKQVSLKKFTAQASRKSHILTCLYISTSNVLFLYPYCCQLTLWREATSKLLKSMVVKRECEQYSVSETVLNYTESLACYFWIFLGRPRGRFGCGPSGLFGWRSWLRSDWSRVTLGFSVLVSSRGGAGDCAMRASWFARSLFRRRVWETLIFLACFDASLIFNHSASAETWGIRSGCGPRAWCVGRSSACWSHGSRCLITNSRCWLAANWWIWSTIQMRSYARLKVVMSPSQIVSAFFSFFS